MGLIKMYARPITYKVNGPGTEQTAEGFVATPVRYSTINVEDLADHISADSRVERSKVAVITDSLIKQIREMVLNGHKIVVPHLGSFKPRIKSQLAPNPESVDAASFSAKVRFLPSVELKRDLQAARIEKTVLPVAPVAPPIADQKAATLALFKREAIKWAAENWPGYTLNDDVSFTTAATKPISDKPCVSIEANFTKAQEPDRLICAWCIAMNKATNSYDGFATDGHFVNYSNGKMPLGAVAEDVYYLKRYKFSEPFTTA